jgi:ribokinase
VGRGDAHSPGSGGVATARTALIFVLGSINADLVARVAHLPREGETQPASAYAVHAGGKGANQALAARRAGADATMVGAVGRDGFADTALATLREAGVDTSHVATLDVPTGLALIHVDDRGRNTITVVPGANGRVRAAMLDACPLDVSSVVLLQLEVPLAEVVAAVHRARSRGARVVLNVAPPAPLPGDMLDGVDVLVANEHEAAVVADAAGLPRDPAAFCAAAADRWHLLAVVTLGASGVVAADAAYAWHVDAARVAVVDTTAAGDGFVGAFAAALERGAPLVEALAEGAAAGSYACTTQGAQPSLAPRERWVALA